MVLITLISEEQAKIGNKFVFLGPRMDCRDCKIKGICFNLEKGSEYEVVSLRKTTHDCQETEGLVHVVEVEKIPRNVVIDKKYAIEGSMITFIPSGCGQIGCPRYAECNPEGLEKGMKVSVKSVEGKVDCLIGDARMSATII